MLLTAQHSRSQSAHHYDGQHKETTMTVLSTTYGLGGFDPSKPNNNVVAQITAELVDGAWVVTDEDGSTREATIEEILFLTRA